MRIGEVEIGPGAKHASTHGDIWPMTWADDDAIYSAANDTEGCPPVLYKATGRNIIITKVIGTPPDHAVHTLNPMEQFGCANEYDGDLGSWKASGILSLDGVLYLAVFHHQYPHKTLKYPWWTANDACIILSKDYGASWTHFKDAGFFGKAFCSPSFIQFGRNGEHCFDEYVYAISPSEERWTNNDRYTLGRVLRDRVPDPTSWSYYTGMRSGCPTWGTLDKAKPVLESHGALGCAPESVFHAALHSYLLATFSVPGLPQEADDLEAVNRAHGHTTWHVFQSDHPWGPWRRIYEGTGSGGADYCPRLPCKWLGEDCRSAWVVAGGNPWRFLHAGDHYGFVTARMKWEVA